MATRTVRADEQRSRMYTPPSNLDVPIEVEKQFKDAGYKLRWIRASLGDKEDVKNISKRLREGFEFVQKNEIDEKYRDWFETKKVRTYNSVICVGDLILAKIEISRVNDRQKYYEGLSQAAVKAASNIAVESSDSRMDTMVPVEDDSTTEVELGNRR